MYNLHVEREIAIAHQLSHHEGKCKNLHGHNLKVLVDIEATDLVKEGSSMNMVMDFGNIKREIDKLDHKDLNEYFHEVLCPPGIIEQPTSEIICNYLCYKLWNIPESSCITQIKVTIYEATGQCASYTKKEEDV